jgi:rubrerythrin
MDARDYIFQFEKPCIAVCNKCGHFCVYVDGLVCPNCEARDYSVFESETYEEGQG